MEPEWITSSHCHCTQAVPGTKRKSRKSSYNGNCVVCGQCGCIAHNVLISDSKDPTGPEINLSRTGFNTFISKVKAGRYDLEALVP